ncbi:glycerophosphodiester phosphodiesterase family protein [Notoacmeibacter ruber]|uniref:glycerophosphodiester phosphodiesterase family protein n=1 Tax=Notoacmeibacter ruber TaxID=2670375 RepID=UPI00131417C2|nr:glycerophosphodiester phosphodiesterase family protein [Notoacmeibacter ruber]
MAVAGAFLTERPIAHRGLHDVGSGIPENTLGAASAAMEAGYGIECDVRLSADGVAMVFHDRELGRLTAETGDFAAIGSSQANSLPVAGSSEHIPSLESLLSLIGGKVPLLIELKADGPTADELPSAVADLVKRYPDQVALMSFSHEQVRQLQSLRPSFPIGLTAAGSSPGDLREHRRLLDVIDFVSFEVEEIDNSFCTEVRQRSLPLLCWTVRNAQTAARARQYCDQITFEGFRP